MTVIYYYEKTSKLINVDYFFLLIRYLSRNYPELSNTKKFFIALHWAISITFSCLAGAESAHADSKFIPVVDSYPIHMLPRNSRSSRLIADKKPSTIKKLSPTSNKLPRYKSGFWKYGTTARFANAGNGDNGGGNNNSGDPVNKSNNTNLERLNQYTRTDYINRNKKKKQE